jgi:hypothetical protein
MAHNRLVISRPRYQQRDILLLCGRKWPAQEQFVTSFIAVASQSGSTSKMANQTPAVVMDK